MNITVAMSIAQGLLSLATTTGLLKPETGAMLKMAAKWISQIKVANKEGRDITDAEMRALQKKSHEMTADILKRLGDVHE
jgi:hypothetical protein